MFLIDFHFNDLDALTPERTAAHRKHLGAAYEQGDLMFGGPKVPRTGGIILSTHATEAALRTLLDTDPLVQAKLASYTLTEFTPILASPAQSHVIQQI
ncbi:hypothetical protein MXMO3_01842 [Maritalea myrionectae]|uniref:YCII-related domain-containing protein n=1 Tax=Maritalea myrionectae TaxID=454601 RepID=A0A2R4MEA1_9HYPH|nr:YciI family protein [Maritalea myrionectae]AVX04367.1 hypothetical protein MXMO3_01842 [Maritalea myrionectae]